MLERTENNSPPDLLNKDPNLGRFHPKLYSSRTFSPTVRLRRSAGATRSGWGAGAERGTGRFAELFCRNP